MQNHGFCVDFDSIGPRVAADDPLQQAHPAAPIVTSAQHGRVQLTHLNLNDQTVEGLCLLDAQAFSVQYHPEAGPGPHDARYLFRDFIALMQARRPASGSFTDAAAAAALQEGVSAYAQA